MFINQIFIMDKTQQDKSETSPSRRGFLRRIGHDLPLFSSGFSATLA